MVLHLLHLHLKVLAKIQLEPELVLYTNTNESI
jgi:hypothetical protein